MTHATRRAAVAVLAVGLALVAAGVALAVATSGNVPVSLNEDATNYPITLIGTTDTGAGTVTWTVTGGPSHGSLDATSGTLTCDLGGSCGGDVHYTPTANYNGSDSFTYNVGDSDGASAQDGTVTITINPVNDAPTGADNTVAVVEDHGYVFAASDFGFSDPSDSPPNNLQAVMITTLPAAGSLTDNGAAVTAGDLIPVADISGGLLVFTPDPNANGSGYASFTFQVQDDGGTANGGVDTDPTPRTMTVDVTAVNDPPSFTPGPDELVNQDTGAFTATSWATSISPGPLDESSQAVTFSFTADDNPTLFSAAPAVSSDGTLTFTPAAGHSGTANLTLVAQDDGGTANGGVDTSSGVSVVIRVNANPNAVNDTATVPENSTGTVIDVLANDTSLPDPPETLTITGVSSGSILGPLHGTASVTGSGTTVTYRPVAGYYGSDFFRYYIADPYGATDYADVLVTIAKDTTPPTVTAPVLRIRTVTTMTSTSLAGTVAWSGHDTGVGISKYELQRSVNGGAYAGITLSSATSTSVNLNYTMSSSVRFRVRATDRNGNVSGWAYSPTERPSRYEETSGYIAYGGTWYRVYNSNDSGLYAKYAAVSGRSATFTHSMRDVAFVGPTSSGRGTIYIYVDGVKVKTLSLKTSTTQYRRVLWTWHFSSLATHKIKIVVSGNVRVDLDCFVILS